MPRKTAADFPREVLNLFDQYVHGVSQTKALSGANNSAQASDLTISAVAGQVGFTSQGAFAKAFRASIGERPSDYRKRIQRGDARLPRSRAG